MNPSGPASQRSVSGSRREVSHQHNLGAIARLVHHRRSITRAQLTTITGLNRSTVGSLVSQLESFGLVEEGDAISDNTVGRPSPVVTPRGDVVAVVVVPDLDAITLSLVGLGSVVHETQRLDLDAPPTVEATVEAAAQAIERTWRGTLGTKRLTGVVFAVPGLVNRAKATVTLAPHLEWQDEPLGEVARKRLNVPAFVGNDATLATVAEATFGAARDHMDVIYLNGSVSGIGGGALVGGVPLRGADGYAGELGHTLVDSDGRTCHCGRRGCLETEVNVQRLAETLSHAQPRDLLDHLPRETPLAAAELDRQADVLGHGIANLISVFNPRMVVVGGYLAALFEARTDRVQQAVVADAFTPLADHVTIERATLGAHVIAVGAAELAFAPVLADPAAVSN